MKKVFVFLTVFFVFLFCFSAVMAASPSDVVINEVAWMGTITSANDEWIELKNNTGQDINLDGWTLRAADGTPEIKLAGIISANGFYLLERTDNGTVPGIKADLIYRGALGNNGEDLWLYDGNNNLIDEANCTDEWFAGDNTTKQTMEKSSTGWQMSKDAGGTPKSQNSTGVARNSTPRVKNNVEQKPTGLPKIEKSDSSKEINESLAAVSQSIKQEETNNTNPWFLFLVALIVTILSIIVVLFVKFKFSKHVGS